FTTTFLPIPGQPSTLAERPIGCSFAPRCPGFTAGRCDRPIPIEELAPSHRVRCVRAREGAFEPEAQQFIAPATQAEKAPVIAAEDLSKVYAIGGSFLGLEGPARQLFANEGLSLEARRGQILAVVGESGSGKTTFARILAGLQEASGGKLIVLGSDIAAKTV